MGVVAGLGGIAFQICEQFVFHVLSSSLAGFNPAETAGESSLFAASQSPFSSWTLLLVLTLGGLVVGLIVFKIAPEAEGHGTDAAIDAFHKKRGYIRPAVPIVKLFASAITIGPSRSGGREGPIALIGAGFGSYIASVLRLPIRDRRILLAAGMGAGVGAVFRAPLAGALFASEILYRDSDLEADVIVPAATASIVSYCVFSQWLPHEIRYMPLFGNNLRHELNSLAELLPMAILAIALVAVGVLYIKAFYGVQQFFKRLKLCAWIKPAIGAFLTGIIGLSAFYLLKDERALAVLGTGYGSLQQALVNPASLGFELLISIALIKILTTSCTIGSGGSGKDVISKYNERLSEFKNQEE